MEYDGVWVFCGQGGRLPSAVFRDRTAAETWIKKHGLTGNLTKYPVGMSVYDWAIANAFFKVKKEEQRSPAFVGSFTCASLVHYHYEDGACGDAR